MNEREIGNTFSLEHRAYVILPSLRRSVYHTISYPIAAAWVGRLSPRLKVELYIQDLTVPITRHGFS